MDKKTLQTLADYNHWANKRLLTTAGSLSKDQLWHENYLAAGSVIATLLHIPDTQNFWRITAQTGSMPQDEPTASDYPDIVSLRPFWLNSDEELISFIASLSDAELQQEVEYTLPRAGTRHKVLWHILFHILNHSTHHRAEVGQFMAGLDHPVGDVDFIIFAAKNLYPSPKS